jgi:hypothetical protein
MVQRPILNLQEEKRMKRAAFTIFLLVMVLATCQAPQNLPESVSVVLTQTNVPATETTVTPTPTVEPASEGKLPAPSFPAKLYVSKTGGFALDYPDGWTVNETVVGDRGTQIQFLSSPELAEATTIPAGSTRVNAVIYQWDPKNDLDAYVQQRKTAWEASGFTILEEQPLTIELGLPAVLLTIQTPESQVVYLVAALQDQYLVISGEGDLALAKQIMERVRPITP